MLQCIKSVSIRWVKKIWFYFPISISVLTWNFLSICSLCLYVRWPITLPNCIMFFQYPSGIFLSIFLSFNPELYYLNLWIIWLKTSELLSGFLAYFMGRENRGISYQLCLFSGMVLPFLVLVLYSKVVVLSFVWILFQFPILKQKALDLKKYSEAQIKNLRRILSWQNIIFSISSLS